MFTVTQIKAAHSKVKSGADFPAYIQEIKALGVAQYETFISNGHTNYFDIHNNKVPGEPKYDALTIAATADAEQFKSDLKAHQQGQTNFPTFCNDCAKSGIEKWVVRMDNMTCTYFDKSGNAVLVEAIP